MWQRAAPGENTLHDVRIPLSLVSNTRGSVNPFLYRLMCVSSLRTANFSNALTISPAPSQRTHHVWNSTTLSELTIPPETLSGQSLV